MNQPTIATAKIRNPRPITTTLNFSPIRNIPAPIAITSGHHEGGKRWLGPTSGSASGSVSAKSNGEACSRTVAMYSSATANTPSITAPASSFAIRP
jgi:hypothetical protein